MMARGESGRIVVEVDPALKRELYAALALSGSTLKDWFLQSAQDYCSSGVQRSLFSDLGTLLVSEPKNGTVAAERSLNEVQTEPGK